MVGFVGERDIRLEVMTRFVEGWRRISDGIVEGRVGICKRLHGWIVEKRDVGPINDRIGNGPETDGRFVISAWSW